MIRLGGIVEELAGALVVDAAEGHRRRRPHTPGRVVLQHVLERLDRLRPRVLAQRTNDRRPHIRRRPFGPGPGQKVERLPTVCLDVCE